MIKNIMLDNNYYFVQVTDISFIDYATIDIKNLNYSEIVINDILLLMIDFSTINECSYKKMLKNLMKLKKKVSFGIKNSLDNTVLLGYLLNYCESNAFHNDFLSAINAIFYNNTIDMYNFIYDTVCDYLDSYFYGKNLCDFKNNKCGEKINTSSTTGCCHHFKVKWLGIFSKLVLCEYLKKDYSCGAKCISCKLFTCDYLEKKGIKFRIKDILLLNAFFNPLQKYFIKYMVYTPKEKIIKRLMIL